MAVLESKFKVLSCTLIVIVIDTLPAFQVGKHHSPAHGEEAFVKLAFLRINLHVHPSEEHLAILEVVESEHQLDSSHSNKEGNEEPIVGGRVVRCLLNATEESHQDCLSLFQTDMTGRLAVSFVCLDYFLLLICFIVSCDSILNE